MSLYETVKVFDLSKAPLDVRDSDELSALRPTADNVEPAILTLKVGDFDTPREGPAEDCITQEITLAEYRLHQWLRDQGAGSGEKILLLWKDGVKW